jgi:hypothetical protein
MSGPDETPWYRQPLVWLLILFPLAAVVGGVFTLMLAIESNDGLVEDDYYQRGKEINLVLDRDLAAASLGLSARIDIDADTLTVRLTANPGYALPAQVTFDLLHATRSGYDQHLTMMQMSAGVYHVALPAQQTIGDSPAICAGRRPALCSCRCPTDNPWRRHSN